MKKPTLIIGKKHIIMTCLTLMLAVAVYINYAAAPKISGEEKKKSDDNYMSVSENINYGETELVNGGAEGDLTADYFAQARLDKMNNRDEAVQTLQSIIGGAILPRTKWSQMLLTPLKFQSLLNRKEQ